MIPAALPEELAMMRDSVTGYLRDRYGFAERRAIALSEDGWSARHWAAFAGELGVLGAGLDAALGGFGGGARAHAVILEAFGGALVLEPYLSTAVIGGGFLAHGALADAPALAGALIAGDLRIAFAYGEARTRHQPTHVETIAEPAAGGYRLTGAKAVVLDAPAATHLVVTARTGGGKRDRRGVSAFLVPADARGLTMRPFRTISGGRAAEVLLEGVEAPQTALLTEAGHAADLIERVMDEATALVCVEGVGVIGRMLEDTVAYTRERRQFGAALASFQALQHRMSDMAIQITLATAAAGKAAASVDLPAQERARAVSAAKVFVGKAMRFVGQNAIQLHGGMGMTEELPLGFYFKRAVEIERQFGTIEHHLARYERLGRGGEALEEGGRTHG